MLASSMSGKLCALWFVVLSALPFTAPFSCVGAVDLVNRHGCVGECALVTDSMAASPMDSAALVPDRSDISVASRLAILLTTTAFDAHVPHAAGAVEVAPAAFVPLICSRTTILRV